MTTGMQYGHVPGVDKKISRIVQGTIQINTGDDAIGFAQMDAAWEAGINAFDTAHVYGGGANDKFFGRWIKARGVRDEVVVLAKGAHHNDVRRRVTPYDIAADLHDTLARMKVEYLDLYVLHRDDTEVPVEPIVDALNQFQREGKIGAFGGSNWTTARLAAANDYAAQSGQIPFAVSSPNFSLADQKKEPWEGCVTISGTDERGRAGLVRRAQDAALHLVEHGRRLSVGPDHPGKSGRVHRLLRQAGGRVLRLSRQLRAPGSREDPGARAKG